MKKSVSRPPIVAVLGHVDHGKTTLLDFIRKSALASREHGGITQAIGAYQIEYKKRLITFIDTPGHVAFAKMRSRGATVADIAILVVASDDSVKPQTLESIRQIKAAGVSLIVAINKIDLPAANPEKVKADLAKAGVQVEGFGGDVPVSLVSAKTGMGIPELMDLILLIADMKEFDNNPTGELEANVIESRLDKFKGMVATVLIKSGTLTAGMNLFETDKNICRVRALFDEAGKKVAEALPGKPVEVLGFTTLPTVGAQLSETPRKTEKLESITSIQPANVVDFLAAMDEQAKKKLKIILKTDTAGSLEAILESLSREQIDIVRVSVGDVTDADVFEASSTGSIIIGFNVKIGTSTEKLARVEKVVFRTYSIIYELLTEMEEVVEGMKELIFKERELGRGMIIAEFPFDQERIAGTKIVSGRLAKGDTVRVVRGEQEIARVRIKSLRKGKVETTKVETGAECGVLFDKKVDFLVEDGIIAVTTG